MTPSDPRTDAQHVAAESLQNQGSQEAQEAFVIEQAKSITRELGTSVAHIVKKKVVEDAKKVLDFTEAIQNSVAEEVGEMLKSMMQVKREQGCSEATATKSSSEKGNVLDNSLSDPINLDPTSPTHNTVNLDDVPLSKVYSNLEKALPSHHLRDLNLSLMMIRLKSLILSL